VAPLLICEGENEHAAPEGKLLGVQANVTAVGKFPEPGVAVRV